jgi:GrpB-like predicted nucleotidyltransferase (UPF0157 family)
VSNARVRGDHKNMKDQLLQKYQLAWVEKFEQEAAEIREALGDVIKDLQHIGSTAIPGMMAKPIIDIGVLVESIDDIPFFVKRLSVTGYLYVPEMSSPERIFLRKGSPVQYHLSVASLRHTFWERNILFRDFLRNHPELREEYIQLKLHNLAQTPEFDLNDLSRSAAYNQGKTEFVRKVLERAKADEQTFS